MAIFSKIVVAVSAFAIFASAAPLNIPRSLVTSAVIETDWVTVTVDVPVTLIVDENGQPLSTVAQGGNFVAQAPTTALESSALPSSSSSSILSPTTPTAQAAAVVPTTTPAVAVPYQPAPTTSSATPVVVQPTPQYQAPASSSTVSAAPAQATAQTNNAPSGDTTVTASDTATCDGTSNACSGDITHWDGGLGACGWNVDTNSDMQIALPYGFMGTQSNGNPYCGKSLTIKNPNTGQTVSATVGDKCMGCTGRSIDLTNALFDAVGGGCDGRCSGFEWWFN